MKFQIINPSYSISIKKIGQILILSLLISCSSRNNEQKEEQISVSPNEATTNESDTVIYSIQGNVTMNQIASAPNAVILTGMAEHRLVTVYKTKEDAKAAADYSSRDVKGEYDVDVSEEVGHFMPGIDILYGYNLLNIAHYNLKTEKLNFLFKKPALIKTLYYPSLIPDSLNKMPVNRNYYLVSAYDEDTNKDTLINKKDLRRFYYFDTDNNMRIQIVPSNYSVVRSQYDFQNDIMYLFASLDANKNGTREKKEPVHIFWFKLDAPAKAKRLY